MADDEADRRRWQQAFAVLADHRTEAARSALRPARTRVWILTACVLASSLLVGLVVVAFLLVSPAQRTEPSWARLTVGLTLNGIGFTVIVVDLVRQVRRGTWAEAWRAPALVLSRGQRRALMRQVLAKDVVDPAVLPLTRDVAARLVRGAQPLLLVGLVLQQAGQVLTMNSRWYTVFFAVFWAFCAVLVVWTWLRVRQAERFLDAHAV